MKNKNIKLSSISIRLNKVSGQVEGIKRMYEKDPCDCVSLITQIQASRAALNQVAKIVLKDEAKRCTDKKDFKKLEEVVGKMFSVT
jgi:DNA-binding FrmR family transcriptional regulator